MYGTQFKLLINSSKRLQKSTNVLGNLTSPHAQNSSLNVAQPYRGVNSNTVVVGNSSQLSSRNTSTPSAVNFVEITQDSNPFCYLLQPGNVTGYFLAGNLIRELHKNCCSHRNFSTRLVYKLFALAGLYNFASSI